MECLQLSLTSWALSSIGRAMGYKPRVAGSGPEQSPLFSPSNFHQNTVCMYVCVYVFIIVLTFIFSSH